MRFFDGTLDLDDHIALYKQRMFDVSIPRAQREECMCKGFGSSLAGTSLQWYTSLPNSLSCTDMHSALLEQFACSRKVEKHSVDLYAIKQKDLESL